METTQLNMALTPEVLLAADLHGVAVRPEANVRILEVGTRTGDPVSRTEGRHKGRARLARGAGSALLHVVFPLHANFILRTNDECMHLIHVKTSVHHASSQ